MLDLNNVCKAFNVGTVNEKCALSSVDLHLEDGDFVTVIGSNGAGKSTLLNAVAGTWPVDSGSILIDGQNVTGLPDYQRASLLGRVFQDPMEKTKRRYGDRKDGALIRDLDGMHFITPLIYPNRCDNEAYISERIDLTRINEYLARRNETESEFPFTMPGGRAGHANYSLSGWGYYK